MDVVRLDNSYAVPATSVVAPRTMQVVPLAPAPAPRVALSPATTLSGTRNAALMVAPATSGNAQLAALSAQMDAWANQQIAKEIAAYRASLQREAAQPQTAPANGQAAVEANLAGASTGAVGNLGGGSVSSTAAGQASAPAAGGSGPRVDEFELEVMRLVNEIRVQHGLQQLKFNAQLADAALGHASHMAKVGQMAHDGIGDGTAESRVRDTGFRGAWGENVARGQTTPSQVVREWMASPTHRANILNGNFNLIAVEKLQASDGTYFWAQNFGTS